MKNKKLNVWVYSLKLNFPISALILKHNHAYTQNMHISYTIQIIPYLCHFVLLSFPHKQFIIQRFFVGSNVDWFPPVIWKLPAHYK